MTRAPPADTIFIMLEVGGDTLLELNGREFTGAFGQAPLAVEHRLADHPLMRLDAIADLADVFPGRIERHRGDQSLVVPGGAPDLDDSPSAMVRGIESNGCWMVFWYIEQVPEYRQLLDECVDQAEALLPAGTGPAIQREAFLFLSAPDSLTPIHFDAEHNFLLQIRGQKTMNVCPFDSEEAKQRELNRYHDGGHRNLDALPSEGQAFVLDPGHGVYVPSFMPHWVQNGPAASISLSITFRTRESRRAERIHWMNSRLRKVGLTPEPPGKSDARDRVKETMWIAAHGLRRAAARATDARPHRS